MAEIPKTFGISYGFGGINQPAGCTLTSTIDRFYLCAGGHATGTAEEAQSGAGASIIKNKRRLLPSTPFAKSPVEAKANVASANLRAAQSLTPSMRKTNQAFTLLQAAQDSPALSHLSALARDSAARLKAIEELMPAALRAAIKPGPIDGESWCLLVDSNAASAKLRQLAPALLAHLRTRGWAVTDLRLKVLMKSKT